MYHCAGDKILGIWEHIANGMYGGIVVHPKVEKPAKEFYMVFGEIYPNNRQAWKDSALHLTLQDLRQTIQNIS